MTPASLAGHVHQKQHQKREAHYHLGSDAWCSLTAALELRAQALKGRNPSFHFGLPTHQSVHGALAWKLRQLQALVRALAVRS